MVGPSNAPLTILEFVSFLRAVGKELLEQIPGILLWLVLVLVAYFDSVFQHVVHWTWNSVFWKQEIVFDRLSLQSQTWCSPISQARHRLFFSPALVLNVASFGTPITDNSRWTQSRVIIIINWRV